MPFTVIGGGIDFVSSTVPAILGDSLTSRTRPLLPGNSESTTCVTVFDVVQEDIIEDNESFTVVLTVDDTEVDVLFVQLLADNATVIIIDDDGIE